MNKYLYKFYWDCGRMGEVDGLFLATEDEVKKAIGKNIYFGEILGKHSEVFGNLEEKDIEKLDVSQESILELRKYLGSTWSGYNPLDYIDDQNEEYEYEEED